MRKVSLIRSASSDDGTFGTWLSDSSFHCYTGELPQRSNAANQSCIPKGTYTVTWRASTKHGMCYHIENVPGRSNIEIHAANFMGDVFKGKKCELLGCIAPGRKVSTLYGQQAMILSRDALMALEADLNHETFELTISDASIPDEAS